MSKNARSMKQPEDPSRKRPGQEGRGDYYRIIILPKTRFTTFRIHDVGRPNHSKRLSGMKKDGTWETQAWLINKQDGHIERGKLVAHDPSARRILNQIGDVRRKKGDIFYIKSKRKDRRKSSR
ncbi:MAG: hypothetical protein HY364_00640 [Candidatus Aenigmarchaeota archaeon]|nr:hypothetical protein [Candidatus Aenigmarchaeota archaeon]